MNDLPGLVANDDPTMVVEIWTILMVVFLLLFVMMLAAVSEPVPQTAPERAELASVAEGEAATDELVLASDGRDLYTFKGRRVAVSRLSGELTSEHRRVAVVVPDTVTVAELDALRRQVSGAVGIPLRVGLLPEGWRSAIGTWRERSGSSAR
jgi:hypothetical protein